MDIVLLGPPGSGKGTQGNLLAEPLNAKPLSTGDLFRSILKDDSHPLYSKVQVINEGKLVSDDVVNKVVEYGINKPENRNGIIFDGYPRTIAQAEKLDEMLAARGRKIDLVIELNVTQEVLFYRILGRRVCPGCKRIFHERDGLDVCPHCGLELIRREDDNEQTILQRLEEYRAKTAPLQDYYENSGAVILDMEINDASLTAQEVNQQIMDMLKQSRVLQEKL
ncbi:MAG: adenylate kinase [Caldicoprobacterales bacterium]|nr:adenylate kinase [Clostridiales bacterium]